MRAAVAGALGVIAVAVAAAVRRRRPARGLLLADLGVELSADPRRFRASALVDFLHKHSYWGSDRPEEVIRRSVANAAVVGAYCVASGRQVGGLRLVTDFATTAYVADVFVDQAQRGRGLGVRLVEFALALPEMATVRRWVLLTKDAHGLYEKFGFAADGEWCMTLLRPAP